MARYGGEEFTIVMPGAGPQQALELAERVQRAVLALAAPHPAAPAGVITVSIGVSCEVPTGGRVVADLIADADTALYEAKHRGRNRVELAARPLAV